MLCAEPNEVSQKTTKMGNIQRVGLFTNEECRPPRAFGLETSAEDSGKSPQLATDFQVVFILRLAQFKNFLCTLHHILNNCPQVYAYIY